MGTKDEPTGSAKPIKLQEHERCESRHSASNLPTVRCDKRGINYHVTGKLAHGFAVLCDHHRKVYEKQGFALEPVTPIESAAKGAVAL